MKISFWNNAQIRHVGFHLGIFLTKNLIYSVKFGNINIKRKGELGFLRLSRNLYEEKFLVNLDLKGKIVYDIGAYIGVLTSFFGKSVGNTGRVIAFEPNPDNYIKAKETVGLNNLLNVDVLNIGIADATGDATLAVRFANTGTSSINPAIKTQIMAEKYSELLNISVDTIDHCIIDKKLPPPNFIKMDIEGMEYNALIGLEQTIKRYSPQMYIEIHGAGINSKIDNIKRIFGLLASHGYEVLHVESEKTINIDNVEVAFQGHIFCKKMANS